MSAHPVDMTFEAESFPTRTMGVSASEPSASGGYVWTSTAAGSIATPWFAEHQGTYRIWVVARGVPSSGVYPQMSVYVDGRAVGHFWLSDGWTDYKMEDTVALTNHDLRIYFSNPGGSRAIFVDFARIEILNHDDPLPIWREVENFPTKTTGGLSSDVRASANRSWNLWSNGYARTDFSVTAPTTFRASIWARADLPDATPAEMKLRVDDVVLTTFQVRNAAIWQEHRTNFTVPAGSHKLDLVYTNDMNTAAGDRNLRVDAVKLLPIAVSQPEPTQTTRYEVESFPTRSNGGIYSDPTASGGKGWNQWSNGAASMTLTLSEAQLVDFAVRARGSAVNGVWPIMELRVDGVAIATWDVIGGNYATYSDTAQLSAGSHTIAIAFTNDAKTSTEDRNLRSDHLDVTLHSGTQPDPDPDPDPEPTPPQRFEVESFPTKSNGGVYTDSLASGGKGWKQWSNGQASMTYTMERSERIEFTVRSKGQVAGGVWPLMSLIVDEAVIAEWSVASTSYKDFTIAKNLSDGTHTFAIAFSNNGAVGTEDRNLLSDFLDVRSLGNATVLPRPPLPTEPTPPIPGLSQWRMAGYDNRGSHFNQYESRVSAANASTMQLAWSYTTPRTVFTTPSVVDGVAYFGDFGGTIYAVNVATGALKWKNADAPGSVSSAGFAVADGRVYHGKSGGEVIARYASNGTIVWRVDPEPNPNAFIWSAPVYHEGKLYIGIASTQEAEGYTSTPNFRGSFLRIDAATGRVDWQFYVVPSGYTGGAMWSVGALDPDARLVYFGTGNAYTAPAHENTDAIIALDMDTGAMRWATQGFANDVWTANNPDGPDTDFAMPTILFNTSTGDKMVGNGNKIGDFFGLDHDTGALIYRAHPQKVGQGFFGPAAYAYGRLYAMLGGDKVVIAMDPDTGRVLWRAPVTATTYGGVTVANGAVFTATSDGAVWAFDAITGALLWKGQVPSSSGEVLGTVSVAEGTLLVPYSVAGSTNTGGVAAFRPT